jgi:maltooligosyltrehalose trehalohydrolase
MSARDFGSVAPPFFPAPASAGGDAAPRFPAGEGALGAVPFGRGSCGFTVWAPFARQVAVELLAPEDGRVARLEPLRGGEHGYHAGILEAVDPGQRYRFRLSTERGELSRPDPASRSQPTGVHGASEVVELRGGSRWEGRPLEEYVLYELHVGTFTREGTFEAVIPRLDDLVHLGVTAVELMPVAEFPGGRNWGYDGTFPFAAQSTYGGPEGLRRLVEACHARGLAVVLDVVYNHLGPEGNRLADYGPYFTDRYRTPWGDALNFDGGGSDAVRRFFIENALFWTRDFGIDALRLDAVHAILDTSATHVLEELAEAVHAEADREGRRVLVIAESDANDPRLVRERERGGFGLDAQWSDDFHHSIHALVTGERGGYYRDFGTVHELAEVFRHAWVYRGRYSPYRGRRHGRAPGGLPSARFLAYAQNHDQIGNRARGDRLSTLVDGDTLRAVATATLLSPFTPLLFMGEEYGESAPFPYFVSHTDPELVEAVRRGRRAEFAAFGWEGELPDPQAEETFRSARPDPALGERDPHRGLRELHRELLVLRKELKAAGLLDGEERRVEVAGERSLAVLRVRGGREALLLLHFGDETFDFAGAHEGAREDGSGTERSPDTEWPPAVELAPGANRPPGTDQRSGAEWSPGTDWTLRLATAHTRWSGPGGHSAERPLVLPPRSAALLLRGVS